MKMHSIISRFAVPSFGKEGLGVVAIYILLLCVSCSNPSVPTQYTDSQQLPDIYPDYVGVTVPVNIAPLSIELRSQADDAVTRYSFGDDEIVMGGIKAQPDIDDWKALTEKAKGKSLKVEVFAQTGGAWTRYKPFEIFVSPDSIDPYISYRLISPSYVAYEELTINQRCLENYDESVIYDNMLCGDEVNGQCINCHNYQMYNPAQMQFHARQNHGGTVIVDEGKPHKVNMANDSILSAGVYPSWHPWLKLIAYSTNKTQQSFHTRDIDKIEVFDSRSDLIVYDVERNEVMNIENDPHEFEVFPFWSPDGRWLYYCSAHFVYSADTVNSSETIARAKEIKYNIYRKPFDIDRREFGPHELVFDAAAMDKSATLPRISPDGRWLLFTLGGWGCFHIWHRDADLWAIDLKSLSPTPHPEQGSPSRSLPPTREGSEATALAVPSFRKEGSGVVAKPVDALNSDNTESYHSWSSNGRWVIMSTRRTDGVYTRPFIAHVDANLQCGKPFELPSKDPDYHRQLMKSYNIPEFMKGPVKLKPQNLADILKQKVEPVKYVNHLSK